MLCGNLDKLGRRMTSSAQLHCPSKHVSSFILGEVLLYGLVTIRKISTSLLEINRLIL